MSVNPTPKPSYAPGFLNLVGDPYVKAEFERLIAYVNGVAIQSEQRSEDDGTGQPPKRPDNPDIPGDPEDGVRWLKGPWLLGPDGATKAFSAIEPPQLTGNVNDYSPEGLDATILLTLSSSMNVNMTGIRIKTRQRRFLGILNRGAFQIRLVNQSTLSQAVHRFAWGDSGDAGETIGIPTDQMVWLYYDVSSNRWKLFAIPAVGSENLPPSIIPPTPDDFEFPPKYRWWASQVIDQSLTILPVLQAVPAQSGGGGTAAIVGDIGFGATRETGTADGNQAGVQSATGEMLFIEFNPTWDAVIRTGSDITLCRIWVVITEAGVAIADSDITGGSAGGYGFRYSTVAGDAGWVGVSSDGSTQSVTSMVAAIAANTTYRLTTRVVYPDIFFSVNGGAEITHSLNLPDLSAALRWKMAVITKDTGGGAGAIRRLTFVREWGKYGNEPL